LPKLPDNLDLPLAERLRSLEMRGITRLFVVWLTAITLVLLAAVGASAAAGNLGTAKAAKALVTLVSEDNNGKHTGECHPPGLSKHHHKHGTPGHKNHPCGEDGDDSD
jgi:hypothetical protein